MKIIPRSQHSISRKEISKNALKVLYRLNQAGYEAYLVGGSVRDLLLGKKPKDFDITTNATPEQMRKLFCNCRLVGRRFRLAHVTFRTEIIEVATFRAHQKLIENDKKITKTAPITRHNKNFFTKHNKGILLRDNTFGSIEEDAQRRDFSINSLYYNIIDFTVRDYTGGLKDLREGKIRLIGDPEIRYREDPVRMLRAIRFAAKLGMTISRETAEPISTLATLLKDIPPARLFEEALKLLQTGYGEASYHLLRKHKLFQLLFPMISQNFTENGNSYIENMVIHVLNNIDRRLQSDIWVNPAFLFAAMLWYPLLEYAKKLNQKNEKSFSDTFSLAMNYVLSEQCRSLAIPKRITILMRDMWQLQIQLSRRHSKIAHNLIDHPKFHTAYNLMTLRAEVEKSAELKRLIGWWKNFQEGSFSKKQHTTTAVNDKISNYILSSRLHYCPSSKNDSI